MNTNNMDLEKVVIIDNKDSDSYWIEEPLREEYYRSEIELRHQLNLEKKEYEFNNDESIDKFIHEYITKYGEASRDIAIFIKELRTFLKTYKKKQTEDNRIG